MPEAINNPSALGQFGEQLGVQFSSAKWYLDWSDNFTPEIAQGFHGQGAIPELTWQPQVNGNGVSFLEVTSGKYDSYINGFASSVRSLGFPIRISLAPEMNSDWEPWSTGRNGNNASNFKDFWRYTVQKFRNLGADNVSWIWAPNVHYWGEPVGFSDVFPGDDYIDFAGLDGYNWGMSRSWSQWQSFSEVFSSSYYDLTGITSKNIIITETASTEIGGNKPQWIIDMFADLRGKFGRIQGFTWFNIDKETDWRINSSDASLQAFKRAAQGDLVPVPQDNNSQNNESVASSQNEAQSTDQNLNTSLNQTNNNDNNNGNTAAQTTENLTSSPIAKNFIVPIKRIFGISSNKYYSSAKTGFKWLNISDLKIKEFLLSKDSKIIFKIFLEILLIIFMCTLFVPTSCKKTKLILKKEPSFLYNYSIDIDHIPFLKSRPQFN